MGRRKENAMAAPKEDDTTVYPDWLKARKDFQSHFPRFSPSPATEKDRVKLAMSKRGAQRNATDVQCVAKWIQQIPTMKNLNMSQASEIARVCRLVTFSVGEFVFRQHEPGDACYMILSGTIDVVVNDEVVGTLVEGASFGEVALEVQGRGRTAGAFTSLDVELLMIKAEDYKRTISRYQANRKKLVMKWLRKEVELLSELSEQKLKFFESISIDVTLKAGDVLYTEGDAVGAVYFIKSGIVRMEKNIINRRKHRRPSSKNSWITQIYKSYTRIGVSKENPSDFFGNELFLQMPARIHTAIAQTDVHLIAINKMDCTTFFFQGKSIEKMAEKYYKLQKKFEKAKKAYFEAALQIKPVDEREKEQIEQVETAPLIMKPRFPKNNGSPAFQFPCLVRGREIASHPLVRQAQLLALPSE